MRVALVAIGVTALVWIAGCAPAHDPRADAIAAIKGEASAGEVLYREACARCHADAVGLAKGASWYGLVGSISLVIDGGWKMPAFPRYSDQEIADLFAFIGSLRK
jgi:mono/diheme cytochrome c family protein